MTVALRLEGFSYAWPGAHQGTLRELCLELPQGACHCLTGATGSGKTTLALALKELLPPGRQTGVLQLPPPRGAHSAAVGLVLQNPETQILTETIGAEVAFGLENLCAPPDRMPDRVRAALAAAGLELPLGHSTRRLSMGQKYRLLLAAQLVLQPELLILDEPAGQLDDEGLQRVAQIIARQKQAGMAILLCEHRTAPFETVIDRHWHLDQRGRLLEGRLRPPLAPWPATSSPPPGRDRPVVLARGLRVAPAAAAPAWQDAGLELHRGHRALLCAPNGAGKTTLLRCLAGLLLPAAGSIRICGEPPAALAPTRIGYLFQNPRRQLFETTVFDEVGFGLRRLGLGREAVAGRVRAVLECCHLAPLADASPHRLSYGQQHLVALASVLAREPDLLLLDDPLAGLDPAAAALVLATLHEHTETRGTTLLWTSHHRPELPGWNHFTFGIAGGRLVQQ